MNLWPSLYFSGYVAFSTWSMLDDLKARDSALRIALELATDIVLLVMAISYHVPTIGPIFDGFGTFVFAGALAAFILQCAHGLRRHFPDPELSQRANFALAFIGTILVLLASAPLVFWAYCAVILHESAAAT